MDKEYLLLNNIGVTAMSSQRDLAVRTGLSLGTVNILLKKMSREGLIKLEKIPANRTVYILTPKGMQEKINKTIYYVQHYYQFISDAKDKVVYEIERYLWVSKVYLSISDRTLTDIAYQIILERGLDIVESIESADVVITDSFGEVEKDCLVLNIAEIVGK